MTMEPQATHHMDKSAWGPGPWQDEPDRIEWRDEATGLPCLIVRNPGGALCGYAAVAPGHPLHGKSYGDEVPELCALHTERLGKPLGEQPGLGLMIAMLSGSAETPTMTSAIDVHGGVTYTDRCQAGGKICHVAQPGEPEDVWWIGFDCAHAGDVTPSHRSRGYPRFDSYESYRTVDYVRAEVTSLASQLARVVVGSEQAEFAPAVDSLPAGE